MTDRTNTDHALDLLRGRVDALVGQREDLEEKLSELHAAASELCRHYRFYGKDPDAGSTAYDRLYQLLREE